ncbi:hypothetical protein GBAR_LOCUS27210 [Geodia barretti]|uniref:Uncharacterized protein n=1 Tax=Geodia barretti TaxID=519541 RepID=A0AA35TKU6_GEOBA|nr:hypothetical protein GBAR_LOCUS27210 [Geodia barretti]
MEAEHLLTVPVCSDSVACTASAVGLSGPEPVVATATSDGRLQIHYPFRKARGESSWSAAQHTGLVELLAFSPSSSPLQLASVSRDLLVLWRLEGAFPLSPGDGPPCQPVALAPLWGSRC